MRREFPQIDSSLPLKARLFELMKIFAHRQAKLSVGWVRVGYVQGNMNSDNCLLSGRTMDYGPFGFLEAYDPLWSPFTADMERKFGFERQPVAAQVNVMTLARALLPLVQGDEFEPLVEEMQKIVQDTYSDLVATKMGEVRRSKLGLAAWDEGAKNELWQKLHDLMEGS